MNKQKRRTLKKINIAKNLLYNMRAMFEWDSKMIAMQFFYVLSSVIGTYVSVNIPAQLVLCIDNKATLYDFMYVLMKNIFILLICNIISLGSRQYIYRNSGTLSLHYIKHTFGNLIKLPYEVIEYRDTHQLLGNVWHVLKNEFIIRNYIVAMPEVLIGIIGLTWYGYIIGSKSMLLLNIEIITCILSLFFLSKVKNKHQEYRLKINIDSRKTSYISTVSMDSTVGKDIRIFKMKEWLLKEYDNALSMLDKIYKKIHSLYFFRTILDGGLTMITESFCYLYFSYQVVTQKIALAEFVLLIGIFKQFSNYLTNAFAQLQVLITSNSSIDDIRSFSELLNKYDNNDDEKRNELVHSGLKIEFRNVSYVYPENKEVILKNINLIINKNENIALIGLNGAGKTTLVKLLCGFYKPTKGTILINDIPLENFGREKKKLFAALFQDSEILPLSVDQNIVGSTECENECIRLKEALELSGFKEKYYTFPEKGRTLMLKSVNENATDVSGGEKQKLLFARALYNDKPILILDEPTAALDPVAERELYYKYAEVSEDKTTIFISHRLASTKFCDRVVLLNNGEIIEEGSHEELMVRKGLYWQLFETQSKYYIEE